MPALTKFNAISWLASPGAYMISLVSPAKSLDYESKVPVLDYSISEYLNDSKRLMEELKVLGPDDLTSVMGLSEKLADLNFNRNMNWRADKNPGKTSRQAIYAFKGDVYRGLDVASLTTVSYTHLTLPTNREV